MGYFMVTALGIIAVGLFSLLAGRRAEKNSSWPTWLLVPISLYLALPMGILMPDPLRPFNLMVFTLVFSRWLVALLRRERNYGWAFYLTVLILAQILIHPAAYWFAGIKA